MVFEGAEFKDQLEIYGIALTTSVSGCRKRASAV